MDYQLRVLSGEPTNGLFPLKSGDNVVGRSPDCAVVFESAGVSRQHFLIRVDGARATLENKGRFGTQVDDVAVEGSAELFPGSKIRFGMYMLVQFEEASAGGSGLSDEAADPDKTAELPAFYKPVLPEPAAGGPAADDSFFLRNDDVPLAQPSSTRGAAPPPPAPKPKPPPKPDPEFPESGFLPDTPPPLVAKPPKRNRPEDGTDPSMMEFDSSFNRLREEFARGKPAAEPAASRADDELFSAEEALPPRAAPAPSGSRTPPPPAPKPKPVPPPVVGENDVHTRGLSPEAIAFMRQEWERKAKGRRTKTLVVVLALALAGAAAAYFLYFR